MEDCQNSLVISILRRYGINEESYRQRFRASKPKEREAYSEMAIRLEDLFDKWMAECKTVADVREKIVIEQLLNTMPGDLKIWVAERKPATSAEAGALADDYLQARRRDARRPFLPSQETRKCHTCGIVGHLQRNCPKRDPPPTEDKREPEKQHQEAKDKDLKKKSKAKCYNCGEPGHFANKCHAGVCFCRNITTLSSTDQAVNADGLSCHE